MRPFLIAAAIVIATASSAMAQIAGGNITGTIHDEQGGVLPGVAVTLTGTDRTGEDVTDGTGKFRFFNYAPGVYRIHAKLTGFNEFIQEGIEVRVGATSDVAVVMKLAGLQESITVGASGQSPIVDTRASGTATNFTAMELQKVPTSRDPFAIIRAVPGVLVDRVNIAGNETGQQSNVQSKGTRATDTVWTLDGIVITDMASTGVSPIYYNFDNFEEIHVTTAGQDIKQPTGGLGVNLVVRRGTNDFHGELRGYYTNDALEWSNVPDELEAAGVTPETADHNEQITDVGFDFGGPLLRNSLWFYGSYSYQDIRLIRTQLVDRTRIKNPYLKLNWQSTPHDLVSFLYFDGDKLKNGRTPSGAQAIVFQAPTALQNQHNSYSDNPFHGLWKVEDNHTFGSKLFASAKFAYFNTGFELEPEGGLDLTSGRSPRLSRSFGSVNQGTSIRPQWNVNVDTTTFRAVRGTAHDIRAGFGWRRVDAGSNTIWPDNGFLALDNSLTDRRVRMFREGLGTNRVEALDLYVGDTVQFERLTVDAGVRFDRQTGAALPSRSGANQAFPELVPGVDFPGVELPFDWNTISPRAGFTYALYDSRRTILRASISRFAGQMPTSLANFVNPSTFVGFRDYRWNDINGDNLATTNEALLDQFITAGGGFNPAAPTAVFSSNQLDPDTKAPVTTSGVTGMDFQIDRSLALQVSYSYTRTTNHVGNFAHRIGMTRADYTPGPNLTGTLHDGLTYDVPTWIPDPVKVAAGGGGFVMTNYPGYSTWSHGVEAALVKRLEGKWMGRVSAAWNHPREHYGVAADLLDAMGNPTRTDNEPLVDGGQLAPRSGATGEVFLNARWQFNGSLLYMLPHAIEFAANAFGRQGYPFAPYRSAALGADQLFVLVSPKVDTYRLPRLWDTDLRIARNFELKGARLRLIGDLFNVFNANTELVRVRNAAATNYRAIAQNLSPRIFRLGVTASF